MRSAGHHLNAGAVWRGQERRSKVGLGGFLNAFSDSYLLAALGLRCCAWASSGFSLPYPGFSLRGLLFLQSTTPGPTGFSSCGAWT